MHVRKRPRRGVKRSMNLIGVTSRTCCAQVFDNPALQKAKRSIEKSSGFQRREPRWIRRWMVERMLNLSCKDQERHNAGGAVVLGTLFLFSYVFLLRVPSEALPAQSHQGEHSVLSMENGRLVLTLKRRYLSVVQRHSGADFVMGQEE